MVLKGTWLHILIYFLDSTWTCLPCICSQRDIVLSFLFKLFSHFSGKDFICVQSMDGTISIFEQESFAFSRFLPGALLPGPIQYMPRLDSFVTASSSWRLESYKWVVPLENNTNLVIVFNICFYSHVIQRMNSIMRISYHEATTY